MCTVSQTAAPPPRHLAVEPGAHVTECRETRSRRRPCTTIIGTLSVESPTPRIRKTKQRPPTLTVRTQSTRRAQQTERRGRVTNGGGQNCRVRTADKTRSWRTGRPTCPGNRTDDRSLRRFYRRYVNRAAAPEQHLPRFLFVELVAASTAPTRTRSTRIGHADRGPGPLVESVREISPDDK